MIKLIFSFAVLLSSILVSATSSPSDLILKFQKGGSEAIVIGFKGTSYDELVIPKMVDDAKVIGLTFQGDKDVTCNTLKIEPEIENLSLANFNSKDFLSWDSTYLLQWAWQGSVIKFKNIIYPKSVSRLWQCAFYYGREENRILNSLTIHDTITNIGEGCFLGQPLKTISIPGSLKEIPLGTFGVCSLLTSVNISTGVRLIGSEAFANCKSLKTITLPSTIETIGYDAFFKTDLSELTLLAVTPPSIIDKQGNVYKSLSLKPDIKIYVREEALSAYGNSPAWEQFKIVALKGYKPTEQDLRVEADIQKARADQKAIDEAKAKDEKAQLEAKEKKIAEYAEFVEKLKSLANEAENFPKMFAAKKQKDDITKKWLDAFTYYKANKISLLEWEEKQASGRKSRRYERAIEGYISTIKEYEYTWNPKANATNSKSGK